MQISLSCVSVIRVLLTLYKHCINANNNLTCYLSQCCHLELLTFNYKCYNYLLLLSIYIDSKWTVAALLAIKKRVYTCWNVCISLCPMNFFHLVLATWNWSVWQTGLCGKLACVANWPMCGKLAPVWQTGPRVANWPRVANCPPSPSDTLRWEISIRFDKVVSSHQCRFL